MPFRVAVRVVVPNCQGLLGGNPGGRAFFRLKRASDVRSQLAAGSIPQSLDDVSGEEVPLYWKGRSFQLDAGSVWATNLPNFAGYGDPLDRDLLDVARDLSESKLSAAEALEVYGVVADQEGAVDAEATGEERARLRHQRLALARSG